jgi:outer membrane protein assembly factor BamD (BamD/ComL family)
LRDARLALNSDPARALALTEQHRREYPNGGFSQEREVIAITALARLGRTSEARSRADRFRSAHPTSPYIERVNRAVPP